MNSRGVIEDPATGPLPFLVSWNLTRRCNLRCVHCYLDAGELEGKDDTSTTEAKRVIDEITWLNPNAMLIMTGGEPLLRPDLTELARYASNRGLTVVVGTNGTMIDDSTAGALSESGVSGVGISLDSVTPSFHDRLRGSEGAWDRTMEGIDVLRRRSMQFQLQLTVTRENRPEIPALIDLGVKKGARAVNIFFLVCTGRGQRMTDLTPEEYEETLQYIAKAQVLYDGRVMVRARCAPHFLRVASTAPGAPVMGGQTSGCIAGTGYLRISPEGFVTPCPYIPATPQTTPKTPSLRQKSLREIWFDDPVFRALRAPSYNGRCAECEFKEVCGGCRARALSATGDLMNEDPWCTHEPSGILSPIAGAKNSPVQPVWTPEAMERLGGVPVFLRGMVKKGVERYASVRGLESITPEVLSELRKKTGR